MTTPFERSWVRRLGRVGGRAVGLGPALLAIGVVAAGVGCAARGGAPAGTSAPAGRTVAPVTAAPPSSAEPALPIDPRARLGRLPNGLTYYLRAHGKPRARAALRLVVDAGSVLEEDAQRGLAHFVEHMAFNGTRGFARQAIVDLLEKAGVEFGRHTNAYTGFDETVYLLEVPTDQPGLLEQAIRILREFAGEVSFAPEEVERERGVVIEEWRLGLGARQRVLDQQLPVLFQGSRYAERLPIGKREVLERASADDLRRFYRAWYRPELMAVVAVGDFDRDEVEALVREHFGDLPVGSPAGRASRPQFPVPDHPDTLVSLVTDPELTDTLVQVAHKLPRRPTRTASDYRRHVAESLYHHMLNARLAELAQAENPPFFFAASSTQALVRARDVFFQLAAVRADGIEAGIAALARELARVDRHGFTEGELVRARAAMLRQMESLVAEQDKLESSGFADEMVRHFLHDEFMPGIDAEKALHDRFLPEIGLPELNRMAADWIGEANRVLLVSAPAGAALPSGAQALALIAAVEREDVPAYVDRTRGGPLMERPTPARVRAERALPELGVLEWTLDNGIRVVLKPTDFKNDEILLSGFSPGGHSRVPDRDFPSAEHASTVLGRGGLGDFDPIELDKALAGRIASAHAYIQELEEGVGAHAAPADLETALALVHLAIVAPRVDPAALSAWLAEERESLTQRARSPEAAFRDAYTKLLYRDHPRRQPPSLERLQRFEAARALAIHRQRFADLSDAVFVIVGAFEPEQIRPLVQSYLGTLPGRGPRGRKESWRDVGARPIAGPAELELRRGREPRATVRLTYSAPARWTPEAALRLDAAIEALGIRLREVVREDLGGSYGVSVTGGLRWRPREELVVQIGFGCAPENVAKLRAAIDEEVARLQREGFSDDVLTKVKQTALRNHEVALRTNRFWLGALAEAYRQRRDPREILEHARRVQALDGAALREALRRAVVPSRAVAGVLLPEPDAAGGSREDGGP